MMEINQPLFEGKDVYLGPIVPEKDAPVESAWTQDLGYLHLLAPDLPRPLSTAQVKLKYEKLEKEMDEGERLHYYALRSQHETLDGEPGSPGRLLGFAKVYGVNLKNGGAAVQIGIGKPQDRGKGYGKQALGLLLRFAFAELNLFRLTAFVPAYNTAALSLFAKAGFVEEVRRREALYMDGKHWDLLHLGLLRTGWEAQK